MNENSDKGSPGAMPAPLVAPTPEEGRELVERVLDGQSELVVQLARFSVTELIVNAYVHGCGYTREELAQTDRGELPSAVRLTVTLGRSEASRKWYVILMVHDPNPDRPDWKRGLPDEPSTTGRGMVGIRNFATGYGVVSCGTGKDVLAEFEIDPPRGS